MCLSADSGTKEMYKRVKKVDKFEQFWKNVKNYAKAQKYSENKTNVETKYILIPNVNTKKEEIDKWLELSIKSGVKTVVADIENDFCKDIREGTVSKPQYIIDLCGYIAERTKTEGLNLIEYNNFRYLHTENDF